MKRELVVVIAVFALASAGRAGPFSQAAGDTSNPHDAPIPGFVGPNGDGLARVDDGAGTILNPDNYLNPLFFGWASSVADYSPAPGLAGMWTDSDLCLGRVTGDHFDIASLGDLSASALASDSPPGEITLTFDRPVKNLSGGDFSIFENGLGSSASIFGELAFVEVSSDGVHFARFPSVSLTSSAVGQYGQFDPSNVFNLAGKHLNSNGVCWGTPFDLADLESAPLVLSGQVNLQAITHVRIVDIPGTGFFRDDATAVINPATNLAFAQTHPIYDPHQTIGSGGFDLEAIGVVSCSMTFNEWQDQRGLAGADRGPSADPDGDGIPNLLEYAFARQPDRADSQEPLTGLSVRDGRLAISFTRDERASDLLYEVEVSTDLSAWTVVARSAGGASTTGTAGHVPEISETSASPISSVGVLRRVTVRDEAPFGKTRFLRVRVRQP